MKNIRLKCKQKTILRAKPITNSMEYDKNCDLK